MTVTHTLALVAAALCVLFMGAVAWRRGAPVRHAWVLPAAASAVFLTFSVVTVAAEGPTGFWVEHTRNLWGNQIWFDLLLAVSVAWASVWPQARQQGLKAWPWLLLILCTGCIGLLALVARVEWGRGRRTTRPDRT